jgi:hypothetical protein
MAKIISGIVILFISFAAAIASFMDKPKYSSDLPAGVIIGILFMLGSLILMLYGLKEFFIHPVIEEIRKSASPGTPLQSITDSSMDKK